MTVILLRRHISKLTEHCLNFLPVLIEVCLNLQEWHIIPSDVLPCYLQYNSFTSDVIYQPETVHHLGSIRKEDE